MQSGDDRLGYPDSGGLGFCYLGWGAFGLSQVQFSTALTAYLQYKPQPSVIFYSADSVLSTQLSKLD